MSGYSAISQSRAFLEENEEEDEENDSVEHSDEFSVAFDKITSDLLSISNSCSSLERLMEQIATPRDGSALREQLHVAQQTTNGVIAKTQWLFKGVASKYKKLNRSNRLMLDRLTINFKDILKRYQQLQKEAAQKVKERSLESETSPNLIAWNDDDDVATGEGREEQQIQALQSEQQARDELQAIGDREQQVQRLEADILDLNDIFRDLGTLVHEQGEVIDSIENNVEAGRSNVEAGESDLRKALISQRKVRRKKCCLLILLAVVISIVIVIILFQFR